MLGLALLVLLGAKLVTTAITLGSAGVGGTFAPSLVLGAVLGGLFGQVVDRLLPGLTAPPAAYALVGMGAVLTAVVRAPMSAVLLLFEVTGDYRIILPIMVSVVVSTRFASRLSPESIYTERLAQKGIQLRFGRDLNILEVVTVGEAMTRDIQGVTPETTLAQLEALIDRTHHNGFPVVTAHGMLLGMVSLSDLQRAAEAGLPQSTTVDQIATRDLVVLHPDQSLNEAMRRFGQFDVGRIPVVDRVHPRQMLGVLRQSDVVKAYNRGAMHRAELEQRLENMRTSSRAGAHLAELTIQPNSGADGRAVRDLKLPPQTIITAIRREGRSIIPRGDTVLYGGDQLAVLTADGRKEELEALLAQPPEDERLPRYCELVMPPGGVGVGRPLAELRLPQGSLIVALRRDGHTETAHGGTVLAPGDELTILAPTSDMPRVIRQLVGE